MRFSLLVLFVSAMLFAPGRFASGQTLLQRFQQALEERAATDATLPPPSVRPPRELLAAPEPPTLGVTVDPVTEPLFQQGRSPVRQGAVIKAIVPGSPAEKAGLPIGGVIVALDGRRIDTPQQLVQAVRLARPDRAVPITYYDGPRLVRTEIQLSGAAPAPLPQVPLLPPPAAATGSSLEQQLGDGGQRPLLGRVGQIIDRLVAPAGGELPLPAETLQRNLERPADPARALPTLPAESSELARLRQQVVTLQQQVEALQRRLAELEQRVAD